MSSKDRINPWCVQTLSRCAEVNLETYRRVTSRPVEPPMLYRPAEKCVRLNQKKKNPALIELDEAFFTFQKHMAQISEQCKCYHNKFPPSSREPTVQSGYYHHHKYHQQDGTQAKSDVRLFLAFQLNGNVTGQNTDQARRKPYFPPQHYQQMAGTSKT